VEIDTQISRMPQGCAWSASVDGLKSRSATGGQPSRSCAKTQSRRSGATFPAPSGFLVSCSRRPLLQLHQEAKYPHSGSGAFRCSSGCLRESVKNGRIAGEYPAKTPRFAEKLACIIYEAGSRGQSAFNGPWVCAAQKSPRTGRRCRPFVFNNISGSFCHF
jgi:hypothetical protein